MSRIKVQSPVVDLGGDEMTRIIWQFIKDRLIFPYLDLDLGYYDLSIQDRDATGDQMTIDAANAIKEYGVGIRCTTITPDEARVEEFGLKKMWGSPNGTIRNILGGVVLREPIIVDSVPRLVLRWTKPIIMGRHVFGDQYRATDFKVPGAGTVTLTFAPDDGSQPIEHEVVHMPKDGSVIMGMYNFNEPTTSFARASFEYGLKKDYPVYLSTKNAVLKVHDDAFKNIFIEVFEREYKERFDATGLSYEHRLINDVIASSLEWSGGYVWTCKNYDGGAQSGTVAQGFGPFGLTTSVLVTPDGRTMEAEAAHGAVTRHYHQHQKGEKASTNPIASILAWTRGLTHRGMLDSTPELIDFTRTLEEVVISTIEGERMTEDLAMLISDQAPWLATEEFLNALGKNLTARLSR